MSKWRPVLKPVQNDTFEVLATNAKSACGKIEAEMDRRGFWETLKVWTEAGKPVEEIDEHII